MYTVKQVGSTIYSAGSNLVALTKGLAAGVTGAALAANQLRELLRSKKKQTQPKKSSEVIEMKKSTFVALLVALAAVAGVLGALYVYVLRREKELDEYEQLLFCEDFSDEMEDGELEEILAEEAALEAAVEAAE